MQEQLDIGGYADLMAETLEGLGYGDDGKGDGEMVRLPVSREFIERAAKQHPESEDFQLYRGWVLFDEKDFKGARRHLTKAKGRPPGRPVSS